MPLTIYQHEQLDKFQRLSAPAKLLLIALNEKTLIKFPLVRILQSTDYKDIPNDKLIELEKEKGKLLLSILQELNDSNFIASFENGIPILNSKGETVYKLFDLSFFDQDFFINELKFSLSSYPLLKELMD